MSNLALIKNALDILELPALISLKDIKNGYRFLSKQYHPDIANSSEQFIKINESYKILISYIENYRFTFSDEEIIKQYPSDDYVRKFRN